MTEDLDILHVRDMVTESDVFIARRLARNLAAALDLDTHGQVRFATALSEIARDTLAAGGARIAFGFNPAGALTVVFTTRQPLSGELADLPGLMAAQRLADDVALVEEPSEHSVIILTRRLPSGVVLDPDRRRQIRSALETAAPASPLEDLRTQNSDLLVAFEQVQAKQQELVQLNNELEETNKGVLALYGQLSAELEETNRGVVALYAELDERGLALQEANEAKGRFLRSVSHELRTPVNSILGLARLLLDPAEPLHGEQRRQVELIHGSAGRLLTRVNELLDLAKAESGRIEPVWVDVDLGVLFATLRGTIRPLVADGVTLVVGDPAGVRPLRSDEGLLRDVLHNLLSNAAKFTEHGEIQMTATVEPAGSASERGPSGPGAVGPGAVLISVRDTGIGIAPADQPKVFDEFYQVQGPVQARVKGSGLGLPYARRLAAILGGTLELTSEVGQGSTFTVRLPYQDAAVGPVGPVGPAGPAGVRRP